MNDLPPQGDSGNPQQPPTGGATGTISLGKEGESAPASELSVRDTNREMDIPKEILSVGVKVQPTVINIPKPIAHMGVKPIGSNVGLGTGATVTLPLTQPQIAQGLKQSILDSWRWLAVWCIRRLKQLRLFNSKKLSTNYE